MIEMVKLLDFWMIQRWDYRGKPQVSYWNHSCQDFMPQFGQASHYRSQRLARAIFNRLRGSAEPLNAPEAGRQRPVGRPPKGTAIDRANSHRR